MVDLEHSKSVVRRFLDDISDGGGIDLLDQLCTEDVVNHAARPGLHEGLQAFKTLMRGIHESPARRRWTEQRYVAEDDMVVLYGVREGYWRSPSFRGVPTPIGGCQQSPGIPVRTPRRRENWSALPASAESMLVPEAV